MITLIALIVVWCFDHFLATCDFVEARLAAWLSSQEQNRPAKNCEVSKVIPNGAHPVSHNSGGSYLTQPTAQVLDLPRVKRRS